MFAGRRRQPSAIDWLFRLIGLLSVVYLGLLLVDLFAIGREPFNPPIAPFQLRLVVGAFAGATAGGLGLARMHACLQKGPGGEHNDRCLIGDLSNRSDADNSRR